MGEGPLRGLPHRHRRPPLKYVQACMDRAWSVVTWPVGQPEKRKARPFECKSWRHQGECRWWKASQDFSRISAGMKKFPDWFYLVLTFSPENTPTVYDTYDLAGTFWNRLRTKASRKWGKLDYVCTVEAHVTSRRAHLNVSVHNSSMTAYCTVPGCPHGERVVCHVRGTDEVCHRPGCRNCRGKGYRFRLCEGYRRLRREIHDIAVQAGFGDHIWLEPVQDPDAVAGYLVKLSKELVGADQKSQVPDEEAPKHFRRLRSSRGLLPPVIKHPEYTGELRKMPFEAVKDTLVREIEFDVQPVQKTYSLAEKPTAGGFFRRARKST